MDPRYGVRGEDDLQASQPPSVVKAGGGLVLATGMLSVLISVQTLSGFIIRGTVFYILLTILAILGLAAAFSGFMILRVRPWAPILATILSGVLFLLTSTWLVLSFGSGLVSLFALGAPFASVVATIMAALSIGPVQKVADARARLADGLDLGI